MHNFVAEVRLTSDHIAEVLSADSYKFHIKEFYWYAKPADDARLQDGQLIVPDEPIPGAVWQDGASYAQDFGKVTQPTVGRQQG
ncbi:hypothetical protein HF319_00045 [Xanthomonas sp. Kuri4-1]